MKKLKNRIYIRQWLNVKPYDNPTVTDGFYLQLCNDVKNAIMSNKGSKLLLMYLEEYEIDELSCFLTSYFEDLISGSQLWNSFVRVNKRLYGKYLPFYELDEYYEEEINYEDICFLIWYFMNTIQEVNFIGAKNSFIIEISSDIMDIFEDAWEYAPENLILKNFYSIDKKETDFYIARKVIDDVLFNSYLFYYDTFLDLEESEFEIIEKSKEDPYILRILNENRNSQLHNSRTRLLGLKGNEWVAEILGENHPLHEAYKNISKKIRGFFLYKGQDQDNVFLEHIASGRKFLLTKKSFDHYNQLEEMDTIVYMGIVNWRNEWWFSGVYFQREFDADIVLDEKNSFESRSAVNFLDHKEEDMDEMLNDHLRVFKKFNNNSQIAFMTTDKIESFIKGYYHYFNDSLDVTQEEIKEAQQRAKNDGYFGDESTHDFSQKNKNGLVFFNPRGGVEVAMMINSAFPTIDNPFYVAEESEDSIMIMLVNEEYSKELVLYCIDNFKDKLPFFKMEEGKLFLDNIDFLLRFWKRGSYFSEPTITFTGKER